MKRALKVLSDREVSPQLGLLKSTLLQLDSTFSERDYGVSTFRDFIEKVAKTGLVTLRHSGRSMMVDAVETLEGPEPADGRARCSDGAAELRRRGSRSYVGAATPSAAAPAPDAGVDPEQIQQIVECDARRLQSGGAAAALADVRPPAQAVHPGSGSGVRRAQVGFRDDHGVPARMSARGALPARARSPRADSRVSRLGAAAAPIVAASVAELRSKRTAASEAEPVDAEPESNAAPDRCGTDSGSVRLQPDFEAAERTVESNGNVIEMDEQPAPARGRRTRKAPTAGKPPARKSTGARTVDSTAPQELPRSRCVAA